MLEVTNSILDLAPIALFVYNRPDHTKRTLDSLQKNELAIYSELFIFSDAPKNIDSIDKVNEVRKYIRGISGFKKVTVIERETNWGLAKSIIEGVTEIVNKFGKIIVLEDDLVTSRYFLKFMNDSLNYYKNETQIFGVTGYAYPIKTDGLSSTFFMKAEGCWSWATWDRAWKYFKKDTNYLLKKFDESMIYEFNFDNSSNFWSQVLQNHQGKINTWAIYWYATIFLQDGLFLYPKNSFTKNIGLDNTGVHCDDSHCFDVVLEDKYDIIFEQKIIPSTLARNRHIEYFNSLKPPFWRRVFRKFKTALRNLL